jgi:hypothetical protein
MISNTFYLCDKRPVAATIARISSQAAKKGGSLQRCRDFSISIFSISFESQSTIPI